MRIFGGFRLAVAVGVLLVGAPRAHGQATDFDGSIVTNQWLALGPFATPVGCDSNPGLTGLYGNHIGPVHHIGCEAPEEGDVVEGYDPSDPSVVTDGLHPDAPQDGEGNPIWYAFDDGTPTDGLQNFDAGPIPGLDEHVMFLATYIEYLGEESVVVEFCFGSDDDGQVWVDDAIVHNVTACRGATACDDRFFATITPGVHVIKMAAWDQGSGWGAVLGMNVDGIPVQDGDAEWVFLGREGALDLDCSPDDYEVFDPPSVSCTKGPDGSVDLTWINSPETDPDGPITILADGREVATVPGGTASYTVPGDLAENATSFCVRSAGGLSACSGCTKVSAEGLITSGAWIALGPFIGPGCEGTLENSLAPSFIGCEYPEVGDELLSGYDPLLAASNGLHEYAPRTDDEQPLWYAFDDGTDDGDQDFNLGTPEPDNVVQYAVTYVEYVGDENPVNVNLCLGSDDTIDVWINSERVAFISACRGRGTCQDTRMVSLPGAGVYRIAVGVWDGCCGWGFTFGLQDELGDPILEDHPDWIYHGRARPADLDAKVPGGTACPGCESRVTNVNCALGPVGLGQGLNVTWDQPDDDECQCLDPIEIKINGETVASVPPDAVQAGIPEALLPDGTFEVTITNCSGLFSSCSRFQTDDQGQILSQAWTALGPLLGPGCSGTQENSLAPSFIGCEYPEVGDELTEGYDPIIAATDGPHEYAPVTPDGDLVWYAFDDGTNDGDQNFNLGTPEPDNVLQYAVTYIEYAGDDDSVDLSLCLGSDDTIDVWINDERVAFISECRGRGTCQNVAPVTLPGAGVYRIAVGVWDGCCGWGFRLGLQDEFGLPIIDDGTNEEWIFHGRNKPEGFEGPCPSCTQPVTNVFCDRGANGLTVDWENPEGCSEDIRILLYGEEYATVSPDTTSIDIPAADIPVPGAVEIDNGAFETAQCSFIEETDAVTDQGFVKTWLMLGPLAQPSGCCPDCATAGLDYLTDGTITEKNVQPVADDEINTDFGGAAASTALVPTPANPELNPGGIPAWNAHQNFDDTIDYNGEWYLDDPNNVMVYSAFYIDVAEDITVDIGIGSDDTIQVLVDGEEAGCVSAGRGYGAANEIQNVFPDVLLTAGQHLIMTKVFDGDGGHGHRLRFQMNGSPVLPGEISLEPAEAPGARFRRGDANDDGSVNIADGVFVLNALFNAGGTVPPCRDATDANNDNSTNITDGVYILNFLFQSGAAPPPPGHVECGVDPDEDDIDCQQYTSC